MEQSNDVLDTNQDGTVNKRAGAIEKCIEFLIDSELVSLRKFLNEGMYI